MMLSPKVDDLPWYRLIKWIRRFFALRIWIPIAYLSYAVYLVHPDYLNAAAAIPIG